ncbi:carboxypeptidase-like regulatory domain-containing protein [Henriciella sp.]|uniref:carboxypeptidase-like regulatory domain-containing protein n=1 Tax=Henriciella sp. TaxID=1968823 RepID=UPI00261D0572|nr:carboxypeptidase-like regulatory domain-containing protein [Henriciella sp.]
MRLPHAFAVMGVILWHLACLPALAATGNANIPLQVVQTSPRPVVALSEEAPRQIAFFDMEIGAKSVPARAGFSPVSGKQMVDVTGLGAGFQQNGKMLVHDRSGSGIRAELDITSGTLRADGAITEQIDLEAAASGGRLWLDLTAVEALTGQPVSVAALPDMSGRANKLANAKVVEPEAKFIPVSGVPLGHQSTRNLRPFVATKNIIKSAPLRPAGFSGVFDERVKTPANDSGRKDWRSTGSWDIEATHRSQPAISENLPETDIVSFQNVAADTEQSNRDSSSAKRITEARPILLNVAYDQPGSAGAYDSSSSMRSAPKTLRATKTLAELIEPEQTGTKGRAQENVYRGTDALYGRSVSDSSTRSIPVPEPVRVAKEAAKDRERPTGAQLQGAVFLDMDGDGQAGPQDEMLEGVTVKLIALEGSTIIERRTAAFGQFGLNELRPGRYRLETMMGWRPHGVEIDVPAGQSVFKVQIGIPLEVPLAEPVELQLAAGAGAIPERRLR